MNREYRPAIDEPIAGSLQDKLGLKDFIARITKPLLLAPPERSITVGLYGPWGHGKTSALNLIEEELLRVALPEHRLGSNLPQPIVVRFNPWLYGNVDSLLVSFFETLSDSIATSQHNVGFGKDLRKALMGMAAFASPAISVSESLLPAIHSTIARSVANVLKSGADVLAGGEVSFRRQKADASRMLASLSMGNAPRRVVVVVDDLDRAGADEICAMLKLLKLVADLPNVSYLVAMDRARVSSILSVTLKPLNGNEFLEKILQVGITLPPIEPRNLARIVIESAKEILRRASIDPDELNEDRSISLLFRYDSYERLVSASLGTFRDTGRVLNTFEFALLSSTSRADMNSVDLLLLSILQVKFPDTYEAIRLNRDFLLHSHSTAVAVAALAGSKNETERLAMRKAKVQSIASPSLTWRHPSSPELPSPDQNAISDDPDLSLDIVMYLFPESISDQDPSETLRDEARLLARICSTDHFDNYFRLDQQPDSMSGSAIADVMTLITREEPTHEKLQAVSSVLSKLSEPKLDALSRGLTARISVLSEDELFSACENLSALVPSMDASASHATMLLRLASRAIARLYHSPMDDPQTGKQIAVDSLARLISFLNPPVAAELADAITARRDVRLQLDSNHQAEIARAGYSRSLESLQSDSDDLTPESLWGFSNRFWRTFRLASHAGMADGHRIPGDLRRVVNAQLSSSPPRVEFVIALAAGWTKERGSPTFAMRDREDARKQFALVTDVDHLIQLARAELKNTPDHRQQKLILEFLQFMTG